MLSSIVESFVSTLEPHDFSRGSVRNNREVVLTVSLKKEGDYMPDWVGYILLGITIAVFVIFVRMRKNGNNKK